MKCKSISPNADAVGTAVKILARSDISEKCLRDKLRSLNFSTEDIDNALLFVLEKGYLCETRQIENIVLTLARKKLYGKRKILAELKAKGYKRENIAEFDFSEIDFAENCRRLFDKHYRGEPEKTFAYLFRAGYAEDEIEALRGDIED